MALVFRPAVVVATVLLAVAGAVAGMGSAQPAGRAAVVVLNGSVGPGAVITLTDAQGYPVTNVDEGDYSIVVADQGTSHNFHLFGPGVDQATTVAETGTTTWNVHLQPGTYTFQCDPHQAVMKGTFIVTAAPATTTTVTTRKAAAPLVVGTVGPGFTIRLSRSGSRVTRLKAGRYAFRVSDRSTAHNFVLERKRGGFERSITSVQFVGTKTLTVNLTKGSWEFYCRPHERTMRGTFTVT
jgi:plastocyanin